MSIRTHSESSSHLNEWLILRVASTNLFYISFDSVCYLKGYLYLNNLNALTLVKSWQRWAEDMSILHHKSCRRICVTLIILLTRNNPTTYKLDHYINIWTILTGVSVAWLFGWWLINSSLYLVELSAPFWKRTDAKNALWSFHNKTATTISNNGDWSVGRLFSPKLKDPT